MLRWTTEEEEEEQRRQREMENLPGQFGTFRGYSNTICDFNVWHGNPELKHLTTLIEPKLSWHGKLLIYCLRSVESCIFLWTVYSLAVRTFCKVQAKSNFNILKAHLDSRTSARTSAGGPADICRRTSAGGPSWAEGRETIVIRRTSASVNEPLLGCHLFRLCR
jgi:hypothetical protein